MTEELTDALEDAQSSELEARQQLEEATTQLENLEHECADIQASEFQVLSTRLEELERQLADERRRLHEAEMEHMRVEISKQLQKVKALEAKGEKVTHSCNYAPFTAPQDA